MSGAVYVLVPDDDVLYRDALQTVLEAEADGDIVAVVAHDGALAHSSPSPGGVVLVSAAANDGESIRLAHRLSSTGAAVAIFDAPEDPAFNVAALSSGVASVLPRSGSWDDFHAVVQRLRRHRGPLTRVAPLPPSAWHEQRDTVVECLSGMPDDGRQALSMTLRGVSTAVIAGRLGADATDVDELVSTAHRALDVGSTVAALDVLLRLGLFEAFVLRDEPR